MTRRCLLAMLAAIFFAQVDGQRIPRMAAPYGDACSTSGTKCVESCRGMENGDYQSCHGCDVYVTCVHNITYDDRPCPGRLVWDDILKRCEWRSQTCSQCRDVDYTCDFFFDLRNNDLGYEWSHFRWRTRPPRASRDPTCMRRGVLRMKPPACATELRILMKFNEASLSNVSFDIGDSQHNNGWGGGGSEDAELHSYNRNMYLFDTTTKHHGALRLAKFNYLKNILRVNLKLTQRRKMVLLTNFGDPGPSYHQTTSGLFSRSVVYLGVNRVIKTINGLPDGGNVGSGLCSACVRWICGSN